MLQETMSSKVTSFGSSSSPLGLLKPDNKLCYPVSVVFPKFPNKFIRIGRICVSGHKVNTGSFSSGLRSVKENAEVEQRLKLLWDDGYGTQTVKDYLEAAKNMIQPDGGPPRWFSPIESGPPLKNSPLLLFLPGMDGLGMGLILHHKALGKVFEVRCLHIPIHDRTPYKGLVKFVVDTVRAEHASFPNKPIYIVGESLGGCLALSVAASNPTIDLVLILVNPATSFNRSQLQPLLPLLEAFPKEFHSFLPFLFGSTLGDPIKMAKVFTKTENPSTSPHKQLQELFLQLSVLLNGISSMADIFPKETLIWKLKLLKSAAALSNSRLHAIKSEVLLLASGRDCMLPSESEAQRLSKSLKNCKARLFKESGHTLLMEDGMNLLTVIKGTSTYRRSKLHNIIDDFIPPSISEYKTVFDQKLGLYHLAISPVTFSTLPNGKIVRGLNGIPDQGPVLLVGYHMLFGADLTAIVEEFLREKNVMVRGMAHSHIFSQDSEAPLQELSIFDYFKVFGAIPATPSSLFKLLKNNSHVLLYPGGAREALHRRGEEYKLFWPDEPEFVRMAIKFGAKIVPFGVVGEDDLVELFLDYNDLIKVPFVKGVIESNIENFARVRSRNQEEDVSELDIFIPGLYPKMPGRVYFLFGKPMETKGMKELLTDKQRAKEFYQEIKSQVEGSMEYLIKKRGKDPYRHLLQRMLYRVVSAPVHQMPSFDP